MPVKIAWHGRAFTRVFEKAMGDRLKAVGERVRDDVVAAISHQGSPGDHSAPYQAPYRQSGDLIRSYKFEVDRAGLRGRIGSNLAVARYLELGTGAFTQNVGSLGIGPTPGSARHMQPRPHLRRALYGHAADLARILCAPL